MTHEELMERAENEDYALQDQSRYSRVREVVRIVVEACAKAAEEQEEENDWPCGRSVG
jgi:hypothetical protein